MVGLLARGIEHKARGGRTQISPLSKTTERLEEVIWNQPLSYPPYGALSRSVGRVGENPGNEVDMEQETAPRRFFLHVALCANLSPFTLASRNINKALYAGGVNAQLYIEFG